MNEQTKAPLLRRFAVLAVLLSLMLGAEALGIPETGTKALILAAIGFVLLTSFSVAETASLISLPRVTGYILTGAILYQTQILSGEVANELQMFNTLALGLIALGAGLELSVSALSRLRRTLLATTAAKVVLVAPLVSIATYGYVKGAPRFGLPVPELPSTEAVVAFSLVIGALSLGTSPSIALAVISESKSKGRVTDLVLGAAVLKDLVVVIVLAVALAISGGLLSGGAIDSSDLTHVALEVVYSVGAGLVLGALLIAYVRYINAEMLLFVGAIILSVAEISRVLHLELLLVFITGGFVVRNFSPYEHQLAHPVQLVSLPVFVVFFTIAGAHIDLRTTALFLPLALILALTRGGGFFVAALVGNRIGGEAAPVRKNVWLGYLPQAGVTLGLLGLACQKAPALADALKSGGMAFIAVNLLLGPVTLRLALKRAGDIGGGAVEAPSSPLPEDAGEALPAALQHPLQLAVDRLEQDTLAAALGEQRRWAELLLKEGVEIAGALRQSAEDAAAVWNRLESRLRALDPDEALELFAQARMVIRSLPEEVIVAQTSEIWTIKADDTPAVARRKRRQRQLYRWTLRGAPNRSVPLRRLARECFEPRLAEEAMQLWANRLRLCAVLLEDLTAFERLEIDASDVEARIIERVQEWEKNVVHDLNTVVERALSQLRPLLARFDSPYLPRQKHTFTDVEADVRAAFVTSGSLDDWMRALFADWNKLLGIHRLTTLEKRLEKKVREQVSDAIDSSLGRFIGAVDAWQLQMVEIIRDQGSDDYLARCEAHHELWGDTPRSLVEATTAEVGQALDLRPLGVWLENELQDLPEQMSLVAHCVAPSTVRSPQELSYRELELRRMAESLLQKSAMTRLEANVQAFEDQFRVICAALLRAQDDYRISLRSLSLDAAQAKEKASTIALQLKASYELCREQLGEQSMSLAQIESEALRTAFSELYATLLELDGLLTPQTQRQYWFALAGLARARFRRSYESWLGAARTWWRHTGERAFGGIVQELSVRSTTELVDAQSLRGTLSSLIAEQNSDYARFFDLEPVRDPARFVANRELLETLVSAEAKWLQGGVASALVIGEHGAGKSSLLNMLQYRAVAPRVIRLEPLEWRRRIGINTALAYSLGSAPKAEALKAALATRRTHVIIDDLEQWLRPGEQGVRDVVRVLELICSSRKNVFWTVATNRDFYALLSEAVELNTSFGLVSRIRPLSRTQTRLVLEARHAESGRMLELPKTLTSWLHFESLSVGENEIIYELIRRTALGNLSRSLLLWSLLTRVHDDECVRLHASRAPLAVTLPFLKHLKGEELAVLVLLNRVGPLSVAELAAELRIEGAHLHRILSFFVAGGMLIRGESTGLVSVQPRCSALTSLGIRGIAG